MAVIYPEYELAQSFAPAEIEIEKIETWFEQHKMELLIAVGLTAMVGIIIARKPSYFLTQALG